MINIKDFAAKFLDNYIFLYENKDNVAGFDEAISFFDNFLKTHTEFVAEFARYRGDYISSDREAAAFSFTLEDFGLLD